jgi:hypothetical protein
MGLHCNILKPSYGDCSNGGLSSKVNEVTLVEAKGPFEASDEYPAVKLVTRHLFGRDYTHAEPVEPVLRIIRFPFMTVVNNKTKLRS